MLEQIAIKISKESGKDQDVILYGLTILTNTVMGYLLLIITSYFFGWAKVALAAALTASAFRIFTGGVHAKTNVRCIGNGALIFNFIAFAALIFSEFISFNLLKFTVLLSGIVAFIIILLLAPVDVPEKPIDSKLQKNVLKLLSLLLCLFWIYVAFYYTEYLSKDIILASTLGLFWQMLTLTNFLRLVKLI